MDHTRSTLAPDEPASPVLPAGRSDVRRLVEAAARAEAQALRAHRHAMALSLRAARAHEHVALAAEAVGLAHQAGLHADLADRARDAARAELGHDASARTHPPNGSSA